MSLNRRRTLYSDRKDRRRSLGIQVIIHTADEGGYWAEAPALHGCFSQGETKEEVLENMREAIECWLAAEVVETNRLSKQDQLAIVSL